ncbi:MAG: hypothetical protein HZB51_02130 [Chloroflexi bacterium]|nr:hypothetical protein [Chloroflexota bacterium]
MGFIDQRVRKSGGIFVGIVLLGMVAAACSQTAPSSRSSSSHDSMEMQASTGSAAMEVVHASYLDLAGNIADQRARVDQWQNGDEASLNIAKEKLERIEIILATTKWAPTMLKATTAVNAAIAPMQRALNASDQAHARTAAKTMSDASHDVTHAFYGDWLPSLKGQHFSTMAPHAIYLDLNANIADLRTRVAAWEKGDEGSLNIAVEKVERIQVLVQHAYSTAVLLKPVNAIGASLPSISAALARKDVAAATGALKPLSDAAHDLTHDFYAWLKVTAGSNDPACIQAAYMDLSTNIAELKTRVTAWEKGDASSLNIAQEKLERIEIVLAHPRWSPPLLSAIQKIEHALPDVTLALKQQNPALTQESLKPFSDASHDVTHAYYGDFLPQAHQSVQVALHTDTQTGHSTAPVTSAQTVSGHADSHGPTETAVDSSTPDKGLVLGGFGVANGMVIALAALFKIRTRKKKRSEKTTSTGALPE